MNILVTGGAGFIGYYLIDNLLESGNKVICVDNFSLGKEENIEKFKKNKNFKFYKIDIDNKEKLFSKLKNEKIDFIYHLAANSNIQKGAKNPSIDFRDTFLTTYNILELMREKDIKNLMFSSSSAIYGKKEDLIKEIDGDLKPISYYGACKLASENFISAYAYMNDLNVIAIRFPNVVGPNLTHGVIYDFVNKLKKNKNTLEILGDGTQTKEYLYIDDLINGIIILSKEIKKGLSIYNISSSSSTSVTEIANIVCSVLNLKNVEYKYTGGKSGWKGDVPYFKYDISKILKTGWSFKNTSNEAVEKAARGYYESSNSSRG